MGTLRKIGHTLRYKATIGYYDARNAYRENKPKLVKATRIVNNAGTNVIHNLTGKPTSRIQHKKKRQNKVRVVHHYHHYGSPRKHQRKRKATNNPYPLI